MSLEKTAIAKTFLNTAEADLAAAQLRSSGIECQVRFDDAGGMYPPLQPTKLLVAAEELDAARRILNDVFEPPPVSVIDSASDGVPRSLPSPPPFAKFGWGLLIGMVIGAVLHMGYEMVKNMGPHTYRYDTDADGIFDDAEDWQNGELVETRSDRNGDRQTDFRSHYINGVISDDEADDNFDGKMDTWYTYGPRRFYSSARFDTDFNGTSDGFATYKDGVLAQVDWRPNGTSNVVLRQRFEYGGLVEELRDWDVDGAFDVSIRYGPFLNPTQTNFLNSRPAR